MHNLPKCFRLAWLVTAGLVFFIWPLSALDDVNRKQLDQWIQETRYLSAWQLADKLDPSNADPDFLIKKAICLLNSLVLPADANQYYLKDGVIRGLEAGKPISVDGLTAVRFALLDALQGGLATWPANTSLWSLLGSANWQQFQANLAVGEKAKTYADAAQAAYLKAVQLGASEALLFWRLGLLYQYGGDLAQAVLAMGQALPALEKNPEFRYDFAYILWQKGELAAAYEQARFADDNLKVAENQTMARLLMADIQFSQQQTATALAAYTAIYNQNPTNLYPLRRMIECSLVLDDMVSLEKFTQQYAESLPSNPDSLYSLTMLFLKFQKQDMLFAVTKSLKARFQKTNPEIAGLMAIYEAMVLVGTKRPKEALAALDEASATLGTIYGPDHPVSRKIKELYDSAR